METATTTATVRFVLEYAVISVTVGVDADSDNEKDYAISTAGYLVKEQYGLDVLDMADDIDIDLWGAE